MASRRGNLLRASRLSYCELRRTLECAVDELPEVFRTAFVLRDVEELSTAETADCLGIPEETVKTRLHRARAMLRRTLSARLGETAREAFPFGFAHCDQLVATVMQRIAHLDALRSRPDQRRHRNRCRRRNASFGAFAS